MLTIDEAHGRVTVDRADGTTEDLALDTPEAFEAVSAAWLRCGWDVKYVHGFSWMGRPVMQLPEDMIRIQEVIWRLRPDVIVETGVAHGGSLVFYASLVSPGSLMVACDGIMAELAGAPRSAPDWAWNNPVAAVEAFLARNPAFVLEEPGFPFNDGAVRNRVTYWPKSFLRRR
jgi:cephalosporin hydroxylase